MAKPQSSPKFDRPNILLIDMDRKCEAALSSAGYNVSMGTFGIPFEVPRSDALYRASLDSHCLPNLEEQDIIILNMAPPSALTGPYGGPPPLGVEQLWQRADAGIIDPRPISMTYAAPIMNKLVRHNRVMIALAAARDEIIYHLGTKYSAARNVSITMEYNYSNWSCSDHCKSMRTRPSAGTDIRFTGDSLGILLAKGAENASFSCTFAIHRSCIGLAVNRYDDCVAGAILSDDGKPQTLLLPQMPSLHTILRQLLEEHLADWRPELFPHLVGARWVHRPEYEIPKVIELNNQIAEIEKRSEEERKKLQEAIELEKEANKDWYTLLQRDGDELVQAVIRSLRKLGFNKVIDVDAEAKAKAQENDQSLREDIQVLDDGPPLIIDVKGVSGHPSDPDALQAAKHAHMRMREWKDTSVQALAIINHQKNLPPHDRDQKAYRDEIIGNCQQEMLGLMTTWDLFKILRNVEQLEWPLESVRPIFFRIGRIDPVPDHYEAIGKVEKTWNIALRLIPTRELIAGSVLAVETEDTFEELTADSIMINDTPVTVVSAGAQCGIGCEGANRFRVGSRVFLVSKKQAVVVATT